MLKFIKFGFYNRKLLLPFGVVLFQILINIMNIALPEKQKNQILEIYGISLSELALGLIPLFNIHSFNLNSTNSEKNKKNIKIWHFLILASNFSIFVILNIIKSKENISYNQRHKSYQNIHNSGLSSFESLELIFISIVSLLLLKYKYFIHHIISIIIFIFISFFRDLILPNFKDLFDRGPLFIILSIVIVIVDAVNYGYEKYMIDVQFHPYWSVAITLGLVNFFIFSVFLILILIKGRDESFKENNLIFISL